MQQYANSRSRSVSNLNDFASNRKVKKKVDSHENSRSTKHVSVSRLKTRKGSVGVEPIAANRIVSGFYQERNNSNYNQEERESTKSKQIVHLFLYRY